MEKVTIKLSGKQYLTIQALFNVVSEDFTRQALCYVWYDATKDLFVATDGHIMRQEAIQWVDKKPEHSFFIHQHDMMLTKKQLRDMYGKIFESKLIDFEYILNRTYYDSNNREAPLVYPNVWNVIPDLSTAKPMERMGFIFSFFERFKKSVYNHSVDKFIIQFTGQLGAVLVFKINDYEIKSFAGVIMPIRFPGWDQKS